MSNEKCVIEITNEKKTSNPKELNDNLDETKCKHILPETVIKGFQTYAKLRLR